MTDAANVTLIGPIVHDEEADTWLFVVVAGFSEGPRARVDTVECAAPWLLESVRLGWLTTLEQLVGDRPEHRLEWFSDELDAARAAAAIWPDQFASAVAEGEVRAAGGGRA